MATEVNIPTELKGSDELLSAQGILGEVKHKAEVAIAEDIEEDRLTQNTAEATTEESQP